MPVSPVTVLTVTKGSLRRRFSFAIAPMSIALVAASCCICAVAAGEEDGADADGADILRSPIRSEPMVLLRCA